MSNLNINTINHFGRLYKDISASKEYVNSIAVTRPEYLNFQDRMTQNSQRLTIAQQDGLCVLERGTGSR